MTALTLLTLLGVSAAPWVAETGAPGAMASSSLHEK